MKVLSKPLLVILSIIVVVIIGYGLYYFFVMRNVRMPAYKVLKRAGSIEIRRYQPMLTATVTMKGKPGVAINRGFKLLADYIFGNNIAMTAPVMQKKHGETIEMTAPVMQQAAGGGQWDVTFIMPAQYTMQTIPKPKNPKIVLKQLPAQTYVAIRFSGSWSPEKMTTYENKLKQYVSVNQLKTLGEPIYAYYNPPWTLPFMRRNEVMFLLGE